MSDVHGYTMNMVFDFQIMFDDVCILGMKAR